MMLIILCGLEVVCPKIVFLTLRGAHNVLLLIVVFVVVRKFFFELFEVERVAVKIC